eukprot:2838223-Rhodomonas_salina.1
MSCPPTYYPRTHCPLPCPHALPPFRLIFPPHHPPSRYPPSRYPRHPPHPLTPCIARHSWDGAERGRARAHGRSTAGSAAQ